MSVMAEIISFRKARKAKARAEKEAVAAENRASHGRSKAEKAAGAAEETLTGRRLEAHRRDEPSE